jgi:hypothetical protein
MMIKNETLQQSKQYNRFDHKQPSDANITIYNHSNPAIRRCCDLMLRPDA